MEQAEGSILIEAPLEDVIEVIEGYESYPEWAEVRRVEVRERGEGGRPLEVAFEVDVPVLGKASYTLRYRYAAGDTAISWVSTEAHGAVREVRGEYLLDELGGDDQGHVPTRGRARAARPGLHPNRGCPAGDRERARATQASRRDGLTAPPRRLDPRAAALGSRRCVSSCSPARVASARPRSPPPRPCGLPRRGSDARDVDRPGPFPGGLLRDARSGSSDPR